VVIAALLDDSRRLEVSRMARYGLMPVLAISARAAMRMLDDPRASQGSTASRVAPDSLWTLRLMQPGGGS
jgi:hypothetical protein